MSATRASRLLVVVWDGMRPDLVSPELTPRLAALAGHGCTFDAHHAVVPTVTRVNAATLATGAPTRVHGLPANSFFAPLVDPRSPLSIGEGENVAQLRAAYGVFGTPTISDVVRAHGGRTAIVSSGTRGSSQMLYPRRQEAGDLILHPTLSTEEELRPIVERLGPLPPAEVPDTARNRWLARATAEIVLPEYRPDVLYFWHDDPDKSQHKYGFGHPLGLESIRQADAHLGVILDGLDAAGLADETLVVVTSDHGYVSVCERGTLVSEVARIADETGLIVAGNGCAVLLHRERPDDRAVARAAAALRAVAGVGVTFSGVRGGEVVDGTYPLAALEIDGPLAPDLLVTLAWSDDENEHGQRGQSFELGSTNVASHGGASSWEIRNTLIVRGPGVATGARSALPSGIGDLAPTLLAALGLPVPDSMAGRVLHELRDGANAGHNSTPTTASVVQRWDETTPAGTLTWSSVGGRRYLDAARR